MSVRKLIVGMLVLAGFCSGACENDMASVAALNHRKPEVEEAHRIDAYLSQGGKMRSRLQSPFMLRYDDSLPRLEFPNTLHVDFYNDSLQVASYLDAHYGLYYLTQDKVYLKDSVRIVNLAQHDTIYCEDLYWDHITGLFHTNRQVRIYRPRQTIYGRGMHANQDFSDVTIDTITNSSVLVEQGRIP